ncbi:hypothetical protein TNCV_407831 [Trichonephila clavipes]|nr:hypothetical protein TNCV_407831 [Trichonephila clavipes]
MCYLEDYFLRSFMTTLWWHGPELLLQSAYSTTVIGERTQRDDFDCELRVSERTLETSLLSSRNFGPS